MMNKIKLFLNLLLVPVYFLLVLVHGMIRAVVYAFSDTVEAIRCTFWKFW